MEFTHAFVKLNDKRVFVEKDNSILTQMPRQEGDIWHVVLQPFLPGQPIKWGSIRRGQRVGLNLFPYLTPHRGDDNNIMAPVNFMFAMQLATAMLCEAPVPARRVHMVLADPLERIPVPLGSGTGECWRLRLGFAVLE